MDFREVLFNKISLEISKRLKLKKDAKHYFISDEEVDKIVEEQMIIYHMPTQDDYENRKVKCLHFTRDFTVNNSVLFLKGEEYPTYHYNYSRLRELYQLGYII